MSGDDASLSTPLPHDLDAFLHPTMSFNLGLLSLGKVNYIRGVDLHSHVFMALFILAFMF